MPEQIKILKHKMQILQLARTFEHAIFCNIYDKPTTGINKYLCWWRFADRHSISLEHLPFHLVQLFPLTIFHSIYRIWLQSVCVYKTIYIVDEARKFRIDNNISHQVVKEHIILMLEYPIIVNPLNNAFYYDNITVRCIATIAFLKNALFLMQVWCKRRKFYYLCTISLLQTSFNLMWYLKSILQAIFYDVVLNWIVHK